MMTKLRHSACQTAEAEFLHRNPYASVMERNVAGGLGSPKSGQGFFYKATSQISPLPVYGFSCHFHD